MGDKTIEKKDPSRKKGLLYKINPVSLRRV
jgi:hypothetical protein